jgi:hypothetical protein
MSSKIGLEFNTTSTAYCLKADYIVHVFDCGRIKDFESYHGKVFVHHILVQDELAGL